MAINTQKRVMKDLNSESKKKKVLLIVFGWPVGLIYTSHNTSPRYGARLRFA